MSGERWVWVAGLPFGTYTAQGVSTITVQRVPAVTVRPETVARMAAAHEFRITVVPSPYLPPNVIVLDEHHVHTDEELARFADYYRGRGRR